MYKQSLLSIFDPKYTQSLDKSDATVNECSIQGISNTYNDYNVVDA